MRVISGRYRGRKLTAPAGNDVRPTSDMVKEAVFSMLSDRVVQASCLDLFAGTGSLGIEALSRGASSCIFCEVSPVALAAITENLKFVNDDGDDEYHNEMRSERDDDVNGRDQGGAGGYQGDGAGDEYENGVSGKCGSGSSKKKTRIIKSGFRAALRMIGRSSRSERKTEGAQNPRAPLESTPSQGAVTGGHNIIPTQNSRSVGIDIVFIDPPYKADYYAEVMKTLLDYDIIIDGGVAVLERDFGDAPAYDGFELIRHKRYGKTVVDIYERTADEDS